MNPILFEPVLMFKSYLVSPLTWFFFVVGAIVGSFLNVCIFRIPEGSFWKQARSICRSCGKPIPIWLNIPIISFLYLRGRSKCCDHKLSWQYLGVELFTGFIFIVLYWKFPFISLDNRDSMFDPKDMIRFFHAAIFLSILITCSVIDIHLKIIPDVISLPMIVATPLVIYLHPELSWQSGLLGVLLGGGSLFLIAWIYWLLRHQVGMGMGDVKLLAGIGGWLGYQAVFPTILVGSISGSVVGLIGLLVTRNMALSAKIPFGPFLAFGAVIHLLFGAQLQELLIVPR
ncbi:MAG: prepilin peptidase [Bdellovibrionota bacterium]